MNETGRNCPLTIQKSGEGVENTFPLIHITLYLFAKGLTK
jgi:hypothetical protein